MILVELALLLRRTRVWLCWLLLCALPALVAVVVSATGILPPPGQGPAFLSAVATNGQIFPAFALALVLPILLPITVAVVAGDTVAGEAAAGTLRYLLIRPVGRLRLLVAKLVSVAFFVVTAVTLVVLTSYAVGIAVFGTGTTTATGGLTLPPVDAGPGSVASLSGTVIEPVDLATRTGLTVAYLALCMLTLGALGIFFSTLTDSPLAAALAVLAVVVTSASLQALDASAAFVDFLPTAHWLAWIDLYRDPVLYDAARTGAWVQAGWVAVAVGAAWANLATKDIAS
ncbi:MULTISPECIES: ABC transporter permease [Pseudonocardia]|uniref:ABC-2 type transport system permease protein n=2 Tax=Pseudonocardia alni TaxID=33907 RepID=A0AA44UU58_PSEA5|nr:MULTISPECIES: ABC transporter permease [Pseudonocardia]MYW70626.1 ABC transporter permease subunit [Pseudonocardia sp. SID8383]NWJ72796.1 ABC transporter permease [Pseudonocardia pini]OJG03771.1 ABC-2 family transporter protein [Pseudonocardia autotrophica]ALE81203.1 ABC transporter permease [Pseudonocardia sp. AL041005-10]MBO4240245.1 ABC transporter permease subunit [Pseudonocardia alni]